MPKRRNGVMDAMANLQTPGADISFQAGDGPEVHIDDPRRVVEELCVIAERPDPGTDPWPVDVNGEPRQYAPAENAKEIGKELIDRILLFNRLRTTHIHYLFRFAETWEKNGKTIFGQMKKPSGLLKEYAGCDFIVLLNWHVWLRLNPMQRVALVYHELSHGTEEDGKPQIRPHDFEGFFHELALFGTRTYGDWNALATAVGEGREIMHQFSLGLLD